MIILCDTNVLIRFVEKDDPLFGDVQGAIHKLLVADHELVILFQNMVEFWNTCTRPRDKNGLGYSVQETDSHLLNLLSSFTILSERHEISDAWRWLVLTNEVKGVQVHDARLAAAMQVFGVRHMLSYNGRDFKRFPWITVLTPKEVLSGPFAG